MVRRWNPSRFVFSAIILIVVGVISWAADDVAQKFASERAEVEQSNAAKMLPAYPVQRADEVAQRARALLQAGRAAEANRLFRDARWQLPALPPAPPEHLKRILGDPRWRHGGWVASLDYSKDGTLLASASLDGSVRVWDRGNGRLITDFRGHGEKARAVVFLPNGEVASAGGKEIRIWDAATGKDRLTLTGAGGYITCLAVSPDGKRIAASGEDRTVRVWAVDSGNLIFSLGSLSSLIYAVGWSGDAKFIGAVNGEGQLVVWDVTAKDHKRVLDQRVVNNGGAYGLCFTPDKKSVAVCGERSAKFIVLPTGNENDAAGTVRRTIESPTGHTDLITTLAVSGDGKWLATGHRDRSIRLWNVTTGQLARSFLGHTEEVSAVAFSPDGQQLASAGQDQSIRLWDLEPQPPASAMAGHDGPIWTTAISPDGKRLATAGADRTIRIWATDTCKEEAKLTGHSRPVTAVLFTPNGRWLVSCAGDNEIKVWPSDGSGPARTLTGSAGAVLCLALAPDGRTLYSGGADKQIRIWDIESGQPVPPWTGHNAMITGIAVRPDGKQVASVSADGILKLRTVEDGRETLSLRAHDIGGAAAVVYTANGQTLATCGGDKNLKLWRGDGKSREPLAVIAAHGGPVSAVAAHPNNSWLATGGADGVVKVWDTSSRSEVQTFRGLSEWVTAVAFSADGSMVAAANTDGKAVIWRLERSADASDLVHHSRKVTAVSTAGNRLVTGSDDGALICWDLTTGLGTALPAATSGPIIVVTMTPDGKRAASSGYDRKVRVWDLDQKREERVFDANDRVYALNMVGGNVLAWQSREGADDDTTSIVQRLNIANGQVEDLISEKGRAAKSLSFSADGGLAVVGSPTGSVRVWDLNAKKKLIDDWPAHTKPVHDVGITPDKKHVVSADQDGEVTIWKLKAQPGDALAKVETGIKSVIGVAIAPDGNRTAIFGLDGGIAVLDIPSGNVARKWSLATSLGGVSFTPDGKQLATANADGTCFLLELP